MTVESLNRFLELDQNDFTLSVLFITVESLIRFSEIRIKLVRSFNKFKSSKRFSEMRLK